jgi:hypothetical protein
MGGEDLLSESEKSLIRRASAIECELEQQEGQLSRSEKVDLDAFSRAASHLRRLLETLGLERRPRDVTPTLAQYLQSKAEETRTDPGDGPEAPELSPDPSTPTGAPPKAQEAPCRD